jgi:signal transduction histidine kinase
LTAASITPATKQLGPDGPEGPPLPSEDVNLTALVQLGALKLDCDRSFLSLIDGNTQYIIAEATRATSVQFAPDNDEIAAADKLYLGVLLMDKTWGVCPNTMKCFTGETGKLTINNSNIVADHTRYIIHDFLADDDYRERPYVKEWPFMRSYAEVPIISPLGYVIGGYCVVDNKLRNFDNKAIEALSGIGKAIVSHLEHVRIKHQQARSEKLVKGLDTFIQEEASHQISGRVSSIGSERAIHSNPSPVKSSVPKSDTLEANPLSMSDDAVQKSNSLSVDTISKEDSNPVFGEHVSHVSLTSDDHTKHPNDTQSEMHLNGRGGAMISPTSQTPLSLEMHRAFVRSASLIRESLGMDAIVFLDACPLNIASRQRHLYSSLDDPLHDLEGHEFSDILEADEWCPIFASSTADKDSSEINSQSLQFPVRLLYRMIDLFPRGQLFSADEYGALDRPLSSTSSSSSERSCSAGLPRNRRGVRSAVDELFRLLPQARSTIFLPLWHFQKERWFAAAIGWTCDPTHSYNPSDATYLSAFGNSIMAEVLRYETLAVSKAKSDFISSVSHEIRSPLHGILAATELLRETSKSAEEQSMLSIIQSCGTTLLDTMNHLLDFAKINNRSISRNKNHSSDDLTTLVDLSRLVEDVTESVVAGHTFESNAYKQTGNEQNKSIMSQLLVDPEARHGPPVLVTVDIDPLQSWEMALDSGGWKRIVMNLLGNALKYTRKGEINVRLSTTKRSGRNHILFSVKDTGIGISDDYLKYQLFTPFAQENTFSSGAGLGLSIVHQIVRSFGGTLDVSSDVGVGTLMVVSVPMKEKLNPVPVVTDKTISSLKDRRLCYVDLRHQRIDLEDTNGSNISYRNYKRSLKSSITNIASKWLNMEVVKARNLNDVLADLYVVDMTLDSGPQVLSQLQVVSSRPVMAIISCDSNFQARAPWISSVRLP